PRKCTVRRRIGSTSTTRRSSCGDFPPCTSSSTRCGAPEAAAMFTMRFDMRTPESGAPTASLYSAALDMCAWAETRGAVMAVLSEDHGGGDGHLPSPLILASAVAARTNVLNILVAAATLPLYHPVRLAEEMTVLDNLSNGRVHYVFGIGHRPEEY